MTKVSNDIGALVGQALCIDYFFFQAEDGIRDHCVTGVQTCALPISGHSWACLAFVAHETLHHAVVKHRALERLVGYCGLGIFCLSPTLWVAWHNQEHHGNAGNPDADPDTFGTMRSWEQSTVDREFEKISPGSGHKRSAL